VGVTAVLSNAEVVIRALNVGVDGLNRWSFTNRGDLDGQWQLVRSWDRERKAFFEEVAPSPDDHCTSTRWMSPRSVLTFRLEPLRSLEPTGRAFTLPSRSVTVLSHLDLKHQQDGVTAEGASPAPERQSRRGRR